MGMHLGLTVKASMLLHVLNHTGVLPLLLQFVTHLGWGDRQLVHWHSRMINAWIVRNQQLAVQSG
jgi:hypothetical protein